MKKVFLFLLIFLVISGCTQEQQETTEETGDDDLPPAPPSDSKTEETSDNIPDLPSDNSETNSNSLTSSSEEVSTPETNSNLPEEFIGLWRAYSSRLFYDNGGGGSIGTDSSTKLELQNNGKWNYGGSSGTWKVEQINSNDWSKWQIESYGPTRKLILDGWKGSSADGPAEESNGNIDFVWVLYKVEPPTASALGTVHMKFGH